MTDNFPIDIDYKKIIDWLKERRKIPKEWASKLKAIKIKAEKVFEESKPAVENAKNIINQHKDDFDFSHVQAVCDILLDTPEAKDTTFFGGYSNKIINDWMTLKKFYEKDNLHIVDLGRVLNQNAVFEIPALKKQQNAQKTQQQEILQKTQDTQSAIKQTQKDFQSQCEKLGIRGESIARELQGLTGELPEIFREFTNKIQNEKLKEVLKIYREFSIYNQTNKTECKAIQFNVLEYIMNYNDDLIDFYKAKKDGNHISNTLQQLNSQKYDNFKNNQINDGLDSGVQIGDNLNFNSVSDNNNNNNNTVSSGIVWDFEITDSGNQNPTAEKQEDHINWDDYIVVESAGDQVHESQNDKVNQVQNEEFNQEEAAKYSKETILSSIGTRNEILSNLNELLYFVKHRKEESSFYSQNSLFQVYENDPNTSHLMNISTDKLNEYEKIITSAIEIISSYRARQLFTFRDQPKAIERIEYSLNSYRNLVKKQTENVKVFEKKIQELDRQIQETENKIKSYIDETQQYKKLIEQQMSKMLKREVKLIGDINQLKN